MTDFDSYYNPPDEPEAIICEECGQELSVLARDISSTFCGNPFCPSKFREKSIEREMAEKLVDALDTVSRLEVKVRLLNNMLNA